MEVLPKLLFFFLIVTCVGIVSVRTDDDMTIVMTTVLDMGNDASTTTVRSENPDVTTTKETSEAITETSGGQGRTAHADGEGTQKGSTDEGGNNSLTTLIMPTTKGVTSSGGDTLKCYHCMSQAGSDGDDECAAMQKEDSNTVDCDGNCWITAYRESGRLFNISRFCEKKECNDMNREKLMCQSMEKDGETKKMCTYCCTEDKCNGMSDASYLRHNGVILMVAIIVNGLFYCKIL